MIYAKNSEKTIDRLGKVEILRYSSPESTCSPSLNDNLPNWDESGHCQQTIGGRISRSRRRCPRACHTANPSSRLQRPCFSSDRVESGTSRGSDSANEQ